LIIMLPPLCVSHLLRIENGFRHIVIKLGCSLLSNRPHLNRIDSIPRDIWLIIPERSLPTRTIVKSPGLSDLKKILILLLLGDTLNPIKKRDIPEHTIALPLIGPEILTIWL
jgi:hypothetical protein